MKNTEKTYHCYKCGERHPRPDYYDLKDLDPTLRMVAFLHAIGRDARPFLNGEG